MQPSVLQAGQFLSGVVIFHAPETVGFDESGWNLEMMRHSHSLLKQAKIEKGFPYGEMKFVVYANPIGA
jgi:hypothetical protein